MTRRPDYSDLASVKTAKQKSEERRNQIIEEDIKRIEEAILSDNEEYVLDVHRSIDGKYQSCIKQWNLGMYAFHLEHGFCYGNLDIESLKDNLRCMKPKLEAYKEGWNVNSDTDVKSDVSVVVNNTNNISIDINFDQARQKIEDMPGLTQADTEEIQEKITELEEISKDNTSKKKKWEKVKPILAFALDKGADVAITIMGLIMQMKLGM